MGNNHSLKQDRVVQSEPKFHPKEKHVSRKRREKGERNWKGKLYLSATCTPINAAQYLKQSKRLHQENISVKYIPP